MSTFTPKYVTGSAAFTAWRVAAESGEPPVLYPLAPPGHPLAGLDLGPGHVLLLGAPPGAGKTTLVMQAAIDAVALTPGLTVLVANVEMTPAALLDRQLARLAGLPYTRVRRRQFTAADRPALAAGLARLEDLARRVAFLRPPYDLANVAAAADAVGAGLVVLDYLQRFSPPKATPDARHGMNAIMTGVRRLADAGCGVLAVSAVGRQKSTGGRSGYGNLTLASFRESSELEYGADAAYLLVRDGASSQVVLNCVKDRDGELQDIPLVFAGEYQRFDPPADRSNAPRGRGGWSDEDNG